MRQYMPLSGICDLGTGEGTFLEVLKDEGGGGVGIEPGKKYVAEAMKNGVHIVGATEADAARVVREEGVQSFTLFHVIEHVPNPRKTLETLFDALPKGGFVFLETPTMDSPVLRAKHYDDALIYPEHLFYFNDSNLRTLLEQVGFVVVGQGRRDFDQYHLPIRESLRRLLLRFPKQTIAAQMPQQHEPAFAQEVRSSLVRSLVRTALARLVVASGRLNYQWVVAQK
jgi:SAM-dependent methyltransferase